MSKNSLGMKAGRPSSTKSSVTLSDLADTTQSVRVNFDISREEHTKLKIYAVKQGKSISDILRAMISSIE